MDMNCCLCPCPNDGAVCSHIAGVCMAYPQYRARVAAVVKVRRRTAAACSNDPTYLRASA